MELEFGILENFLKIVEIEMKKTRRINEYESFIFFIFLRVDIPRIVSKFPSWILENFVKILFWSRMKGWNIEIIL